MKMQKNPIGLRICTLFLALFLLCSCAVSVIDPDQLPSTSPTTVGDVEVYDPIESTQSTASITTTAPATTPVTTVASTTTAPVTTVASTTTVPVTTVASTTTVPVTTGPTLPETIPTRSFEELERNGQYIAVYDLKNDRLLYTTGLDQSIYPASTTKLLTLLYALTLIEEDTLFDIGAEIYLAPSDSSKAKIARGERYTRQDIFAALLLPSGNDAAYTLAATCGRLLSPDEELSNKDAVSRFMEGLNAFAADLGLTDTYFVTSFRFHDPEHVTSMQDMLTIARMAMKEPILTALMATPSYEVTDLAKGHTQVWLNSNFMLHEEHPCYYPYATGCKTGFHTPAGACLIATAQKDGEELMVMVFKCDNKDARFYDAIRFLEFGFELLTQ